MPDPIKVMVVDDEPQVASVIAELLAAYGFEAWHVNSGTEALRSAHLTSPDIIFLDIMMPEMDGYEFCARLKSDRLLAEIPVIFISGKARQDDRMRAHLAGGELFISKPFDCNDLVEAIQWFLKRNDLTREASHCRQIIRP